MSTAAAEHKTPVVIAHRGASGYLPEHTLAAKALAYGMGADFLEQDVVLTKDNVPIVMHDIHLDTVTDVAEKFPQAAREDGRFYAIDFTLAEIRTLRVHERSSHKRDEKLTQRAVYPQRFPVGKSRFFVPTLAEEIELIQGLNHAQQRFQPDREVGIYPEIKKPAWHREQGKDISSIVIKVLHEYGYRDKTAKCCLQCFDAGEVQRIREELKCNLFLIQLIGENSWKESGSDYPALRTPAGLAKIATYADGIGPWLPHVLEQTADGKSVQPTSLVADAHRVNLQVHPYTARVEDLPAHCPSFADLHKHLLAADIDGLFSDFPDQTVRLFTATTK